MGKNENMQQTGCEFVGKNIYAHNSRTITYEINVSSSYKIHILLQIIHNEERTNIRNCVRKSKWRLLLCCYYKLNYRLADRLKRERENNKNKRKRI